MRFLFSLLSVLALALRASAEFPFTTLSATVTQTFGTSTPTVTDGILNPAIIPSFSSYNQENLRYALEVTNSVPASIRVSFGYRTPNGDFDASTGEPRTVNPQYQNGNLKVRARRCGTALANPPSYVPVTTFANFQWSYTHCFFSDNINENGVTLGDVANNAEQQYIINTAAIAGTNPVVHGSSVSVNSLLGTTILELSTFEYDGQVYTPIAYLITISVVTTGATVNGKPGGYNMWSFNSDPGLGVFDVPFVATQAAYAINFKISQPDSVDPNVDYRVPFYFATQKTVTYVYVQECPSIDCSSCPIAFTTGAFNARKVITRGGSPGAGLTRVQNWQLDDQASSFRSLPPYSSVFDFVDTSAPNAVNRPQHGLYYFPAKIGNNCLRFINRVVTAGGENENTITVTLSVKNCRIYRNCRDCIQDEDCGWCAYDNFNGALGACEVGDTVAQTIAETQPAYVIGGVAQEFFCFRDPARPLLTPRFAYLPEHCTVVIKGDPRISGLQGQDFQVHGTPNEYFNLVTSPSLQINSRFIFLEDAKCDNFTTCFSHPGTYIDEIGVMMGENKVRIVAGAINEAARVFVNGKEVLVSSHKHTAGPITVTFANTRRVTVKTPEYMFTAAQSDKFFNVDSALLRTSLLDQGSKLVKLESSRNTEANTIMHGLIGQTWRNVVYAGGREYEGEVADYQVADGLWGTDFAFNLYNKSA